MDTLRLISQLIIALGILNVWLLRFGKPTAYRPANAGDMKEEFSAYGLPAFMVGVVGGLKVLFALGLLAGIWIPELVLPAAIGMAVLMLGAIIMHLKVRDPLKKAAPASALLALSLFLALT